MRRNGRGDWRCATVGDGALLVAMNGLKQTLTSSVMPSDIIPLVKINQICCLYLIFFCLLIYADEPADQSTPTAPSKPLYYHNIKCSERDLTLLECGFTKYLDLTETHSQAIVKCAERKSIYNC